MLDVHWALGYRRAIIDNQTPIHETIGGPEYWADGARYATDASGNVFTSIFYVHRFRVQHEVFRVHFPMQWWLETHSSGLMIARRQLLKAAH